MKVASTASTPSTRPFDSFWEPHFEAFCRTVCKFGPKRGTKMASKMTPLYNSIALWGPSRGSPWETPEGLGPSRWMNWRSPAASVGAQRSSTSASSVTGAGAAGAGAASARSGGEGASAKRASPRRRSSKSPMGGREHYAWAAKAVALGDLKASEHEGPLSQSVRGARKKERRVAGKHGANSLGQMISCRFGEKHGRGGRPYEDR